VSTNAAGAVQTTGVVKAGEDYYVRTFSGTRNRWGDYSGIAIDPTDDATFWVFNEYAAPRGSPTSDGDGRWGTHWASWRHSVRPAGQFHKFE
jgi:hypothetical protein